MNIAIPNFGKAEYFAGEGLTGVSGVSPGTIFGSRDVTRTAATKIPIFRDQQ
jgi:hypothetical protein